MLKENYTIKYDPIKMYFSEDTKVVSELIKIFFVMKV